MDSTTPCDGHGADAGRRKFLFYLSLHDPERMGYIFKYTHKFGVHWPICLKP